MFIVAYLIAKGYGLRHPTVLHAEPVRSSTRKAENGVEHACVDDADILRRALALEEPIHNGCIRGGKPVVGLVQYYGCIDCPEVGVADSLSVGEVVELR